MAMADGLIAELEHEAANTRRLLERVPEAELGWRPHPKSMSLGVLAGHQAETLGWGVVILTQDHQDLDPEKYQPAVPKTVTELLAAFDQNLAAFKAALGKLTDVQLRAPWTLSVKGKVVFTRPRVAVIRSMILNHAVHHRGQLTVYLRLKNVPLPAIYGPSADEDA